MRKLVNIEGMSCNHCVKHVEEALKELEGVSGVAVSLEKKNAVVDMKSDVADDLIKAAVEDAGYDVTGISRL